MNDRLEVIKAAALKAGETMLSFDPTTLVKTKKSSEGDFVTEADLACEQTIIDVIKSSFPNDIVISEEIEAGHGLLNAANLPNLKAWVIDPIDGTNNYKQGMHYSCVSIAYISQGEVTLAAIFDPYRQELYQAQKGKGATRNGDTIQIAQTNNFNSGTRVCTANSYEGGTQANLDKYSKLGHVWVDVLGSAVLAMADTASGRIDLYFHNGLKPWDNAAAFLIAEEAGAKITDLAGNKTSWLSSEAVVGNPALVDKFIELTKG